MIGIKFLLFSGNFHDFLLSSLSLSYQTSQGGEPAINPKEKY